MGFDNSMKFFSKFRTMAVLASALMTVGTWAEAQSIGLSVTAPDAILVSNSFAYIIVVTNQTGVSQTFIVTNTPTGASFQFGTPTASQGSNTISGSNVIFFLLTIATGNTATMNLPVTATSIGTITNTVTVNIVSLTNFSGSITTHVTNAVAPGQADLAVAITVPASAVFTNDWVTYGVNVTNLGLASASNVMLTNTLPPGVDIKECFSNESKRHRQQPHFQRGHPDERRFQELSHYHYTDHVPTNAGLLAFSAGVNSTNVTDPRPQQQPGQQQYHRQ